MPSPTPARSRHSILHWRIPVATALALLACVAGCNDQPLAQIDAAQADAAESDAWADVDAIPTDAALRAPILASMQVVGANGSLQIRQGAGSVRVAIAGSNLATASLQIEGLVVLGIVANTDDELVANLRVPHGISLGLRDVSVTTPGGSDVLPSYLAIVPITANPAGDDTAGRGTPDSPYRTLTMAASQSEFSGQARDGDTIRLGDGDYSALETWPIYVHGRVEGASRTGTTLRPSRDGVGAEEFSHLTVEGTGASGPADSKCIVVSTGAHLAVRDVAVRNCTVGIDSQAPLTVESVNIENVYTGVSASTNASIQATTVAATAVGAIFQGWGQVSITLDDVSLTATAPTAALWALNFNMNSMASGSVVVRNSRTRSARTVAVSLGAPGDVTFDFGTPAAPGNNSVLCDISSQICLADWRPARAAPDGPVATFRGTRIGGVAPAPGIYTGPVSQSGFQIVYANQRLEF